MAAKNKTLLSFTKVEWLRHRSESRYLRGLGSRGLRSNSGTKAHAEKLFLNVGPSPGCPTRLPFLTHVCLVCLARLCPHGCPLSTHSLASPISVPSGCLAHRLPSGFWLCVCRYRVPALPALPLSLSKPAKLCP